MASSSCSAPRPSPATRTRRVGLRADRKRTRLCPIPVGRLSVPPPAIRRRCSPRRDAAVELARCHRPGLPDLRRPTAHTAFIEHAEQLLLDPQPVRVLAIEETRRGKPRRTRSAGGTSDTRVDPSDTGFVDLEGVQGRLGQVEGHTSKAVTDWLTLGRASR